MATGARWRQRRRGRLVQRGVVKMTTRQVQTGVAETTTRGTGPEGRGEDDNVAVGPGGLGGDDDEGDRSRGARWS